jgi:plastocyanin
LRRLATTFLALFLLALPASALAADQGVTISTLGYDKHEVVIKPGDSVTFTNNDPLTDNVRFEDETQPRCDTLHFGDCTRTFSNAGIVHFWDELHGCTGYDTCAPAYRGVVIVDGPPKVDTLTAPASGTRGQAVAMSATGSDPNGDTITAYNWDFGDGSGATTGDGSFNHVYNAAGHFTVTLTVTDSRGNASAPLQIGIDIVIPDGDGDGVNDDADLCVSTPGPEPKGCPITVIPPAPEAIATSAVSADTLGLKGALKSGVNVVLNCSDKCTDSSR